MSKEHARIAVAVRNAMLDEFWPLWPEMPNRFGDEQWWQAGPCGDMHGRLKLLKNGTWVLYGAWSKKRIREIPGTVMEKIMTDVIKRRLV